MRRDLFTILQLGTSFAIIFSAFNSQGLIEVVEKAGQSEDTSCSFSIIYFFFTIANLVIPVAVKYLGAKWSQVVGASGYLFFMLTFLHLNGYLLYFASAILGVSAALLWAGNGCYLVQMSRPTKLERNSGILWALLQSSLITGGIFLIFVLRSGDLAESFNSIYTSFVFMIIVGTILLIFLPNSSGHHDIQTDNSDNETEERLLSDDREMVEVVPPFKEQFFETLSLFGSSEMKSLSVLFIYSGLEMTFYTGVYTSCLSATMKLDNSKFIIPYNAILIGSGQITGGLLTGSVGKLLNFRNQQFILLAFVGHMIAFLISFLCLPFDSTMHPTDSPTYITPTLPLVLIISFLLGFSDALWQTQVYVTIGKSFNNNLVNAFAIFKFFQSFSACISFFYSSFLLLPVQLFILAVGCIASAYLFVNSQTHPIPVDLDEVINVRT